LSLLLDAVTEMDHPHHPDLTIEMADEVTQTVTVQTEKTAQRLNRAA
jgi:hypothetical protein